VDGGARGPRAHRLCICLCSLFRFQFLFLGNPGCWLGPSARCATVSSPGHEATALVRGESWRHPLEATWSQGCVWCGLLGLKRSADLRVDAPASRFRVTWAVNICTLVHTVFDLHIIYLYRVYRSVLVYDYCIHNKKDI
jgi:hypothetical protein